MLYYYPLWCPNTWRWEPFLVVLCHSRHFPLRNSSFCLVFQYFCFVLDLLLVHFSRVFCHIFHVSLNYDIDHVIVCICTTFDTSVVNFKGMNTIWFRTTFCRTVNLCKSWQDVCTYINLYLVMCLQIFY